ncbi:MAG: antibiotic biosynthesis monooxygenase [Actinomycetota bacterium]
MSVVKINAVEVPEGMGDEFIERFAKRAGAVENQPGFEEFLLLKPTDGNNRFFVFTRWESEEAFNTWLSSRDFAAAHAHLAEGHGPAHGEGHGHGGADQGGSEGEGHGHGGAGHGGTMPVAASAELLAFEVIERVAED